MDRRDVEPRLHAIGNGVVPLVAAKPRHATCSSPCSCGASSEGLERLISAEALREVGREGIVMTVLGDSVPEEEKPNE